MVSKIEIFGLRLPEIKPGDDLVKMVMEHASEAAGDIKDGDLVVITSKVVSKAFGSLLDVNRITPSKKALRIAEKGGGDPRFIQAVLENSDQVILALPFYELVRRGVVNIDKLTKNCAVAYDVIKKSPTTLIVSRGGQVYSDAGLDMSNHPKGIIGVPPLDPDKSAREIRARILELTGKDIPVVISDTEMWLSSGSLDFARGSSGIEVVSKNFGEPDLYGKPKFGGIDCVAHELACASALLIGQTAAGIPAALVRGYRYARSEEGVLGLDVEPDNIRIAIKETIKHSIKVLGLKWLLKLLLG